MAKRDDKPEGTLETGDIAKDVARLYSWANIEEMPYRTFSRQTVDQKTPLTELPPQLPETQLPSTAAEADLPPAMTTSPAVAVYSLAGGVGKTTITAHLGRFLCSLGERVLLVDASGSGMLPFYFGAADLRPGLRTFVAPEVNYPPMHVIGTEEVTSKWLETDVKLAMRGVQRTIFDLGPASMSLLPRILELCDVLLIPLMSDLNSLLTVSRIEASIKGFRDKGMNVPLPFYVFSKFDELNSMDIEARDFVAKQCGARLLPIEIRRSVDVVEAIADRMAVADHAPNSEVSHDYLELAKWLKEEFPVAREHKTEVRWIER